MKQYSDETVRQEETYAVLTQNTLKKCIDQAVSLLQSRRETILEERKYFIDYFYELKDDEKRDLLHNEFLDTKTYENMLGDIARMGRQMQEPYFARFDFREEEEESETEMFYLGIHTVRDPDTGRILCYDWRAPVAALYYEQELGPASFEAPLGTITGMLLLKRRYVFQKGKLFRFTDVNMPSDDEFLVEVLSSPADSHMKTIVQTLQKEQHAIIRDYIEGVSVIQGCAGSGKSSIALHKAAYILYTFREKLKHGQLIILSPNPLFAEYISTVLPDLGEENVLQLLPEDVANECLKSIEDFSYWNRNQTQEWILTRPTEGERRLQRSIASRKSGTLFRDLLLAYVTYLSTHIFVAEELYLDENFDVCVEPGRLEELFYQEYYGEPVFQRTSLMTKRICEEYKIKSQEKREKIKAYLDNMMLSVSITQLYRMLFDFPDFENWLWEEEGYSFDWEASSETTLYLGFLAPGPFLWEDACAAALLAVLLEAPEFDYSVFYLIADEAQDFSPVYLELLKRRYKTTNMLFVGDSRQLVYENTGDFAEELKRIMKGRPFRTYDLRVNYRSTQEIQNFAYRLSGLAPEDGVTCVRHGVMPRIFSIPSEPKPGEADESSGPAFLTDYFSQMAERKFGNGAVLCKTEAEARRLQTKLTLPQALSSKLRIQFLPVYLAKGLEFDFVAIWNAGEDRFYEKEDANLLYTACTRAMHEAALFTTEASDREGRE